MFRAWTVASVLLLLFQPAFAKERRLCGGIIVMDGRLKLNANEKVLICGSDKSDEAWRSIPLPQAQYELRSVLRNSGWLEPRFEREGDTLRVWMGPRIETQDLRVNGGLDVLSPSKKRKIRGEPLEPDKLDEVKRWAELKLRRAGHGCPEVAMTAHAWERAIIADVTPGPKSRIADVYRKGIDGLDAEALVRFEAFEPGDVYDVLATRITTSRLLSQGLFQSAHITSVCRGEEIDLTLNADVGRPRLLRFSVGASTEEFPFAEAWYRNTRLDDRASSFTATLHASPIRQSLNVYSEFYILPFSKRTFAGPRFEVQRRLEEAYELNQMQLGADLGRAWDLFKIRLQGRAGPTLNYDKTVVGVGPADTKYLSWEGSLTAASHAYEAFSGTQEEGWTAGFDYRGQREGIGSELNVDRYDLKLKHLWNIGGYAPPLFVFASRLEFTAVDIKQDPTATERSRLPLDYRIFYGGEDNLRGFGREDLNNGGLGYLTVAMVGFELRLIEELPWHLQPFLLWDAAKLGNRRYTADPPLFTSYGAGLRWASAFGTLRLSAARGSIWKGNAGTDGYAQNWNYFFSFGREF